MKPNTINEDLQAIKHRLLVIDSDSMVLESMAVYLANNDYQVYTAMNGKSALETFRTLNPELVICDLNTTDINGLKLIETFIREKPQIPIIVYSSTREIKDVIAALRLGATDYLVKPIHDFGDVDKALESALLKKQHQEESQHYYQAYESANNELDENLQLLKEDQQARRQAQLQLLPGPKQEIGSYTFEHTIIPALFSGGGFLDFFEIDENYIGFYIADITGHGEASTLVTMTLKSFINHPIRQYRNTGDITILNPAWLLEYLNLEMIKANVGKYTTLFYAVINRKENSLTYTLGGHYPKPILVNGGKLVDLGEDGFPVGLFTWAEYDQHCLKLKSSFTLGMFSEGVSKILGEDISSDKQQILTQLCSQQEISTAICKTNSFIS